MKRLILLSFLIVLLSGYKNPISKKNKFALNLEIHDTLIKEVIVGYQTNIGLSGITQHLKKKEDNKITYDIDSIKYPLSVFLTISKNTYQIWAEPNSNLNVLYDKGKVTFTGKGKYFADYYLDSEEFWIKIHQEYEKRNPVLSGRPKGNIYFKVQDSITCERMQYLDHYFPGKKTSSVKQFIEYEKNYLLYTDIFYKISGLTSLNDFKFYQDKLNIPADTFLKFTDKFDFNNPELFYIYQYRRCFENWLDTKYIENNKLDRLKDKGKALDFVTSLAKNETCKKYIEIVQLNSLIELSNEHAYDFNPLIKERIERLGKNSKHVEKYLTLLRTKIVEKEKKSKQLISLLSDPKYVEGIQIQDQSANKDLEILRSLIKQHPGKVLYIDFWAPWCGPCMGEMPYSKELQKKYEDKDVLFVFLGVDCKEESWKATIAKSKLKGIHYLLTNQQSAEYHKIFDFTGIPHYVIVNKSGIVINKNVPRPSDEKKVNEILDKLLKE